MPEALLAGVRVVDLAGEPAAMAGRILADLGAEVVKVEPPGGDPLRRAPPFAGERRDPEASLRFAAWTAGEASVVCTADSPELDALLSAADVVLDTPGWPGAQAVAPERAPHATWVRVTPFGLAGPRAHWRASDLGVMAASGNMYGTGFPDRAPLRASEPSGYAHVGPEAVVAALTALASGRPQVVDVSMQEAVLVANMGFLGHYARTRDASNQRVGATLLGMQEIWPCKDGYVSFGLRGGVARVPSLRMITLRLVEEGLATPAFTERDWTRFQPGELSPGEKEALEAPLRAYFARHSMLELYEMAAETNLMLASTNSPREIYASSQLQARDVFAKLGDVEGFPVRFAAVTSADAEALPMRARRPAPALDAGPRPGWAPRPAAAAASPGASRAWDGTRILEFGSGAAGPIASRYFAEHGAIVVRVESKTRPDFLRVMAVGSKSPHGLEGSPIFNGLNVGKRSITLNLKHPDGLAVAKQLVFWADAVLENFAPKAMVGFGLDYETLAREKPDLVMISSCMNGQTGPHRNYPGFGSQGSALAGYTLLTGYPDRVPVGPFGTITDSLGPRFGAAAMAAALLYRRRTGRGLHVDLSQVEAAVYTLSPWLLDYAVNGRIGARMGNRSARAAPHGAFPCRGEDRWVAIAVWTDAEWAALAGILGCALPGLATADERLARVDEVETAVADWTRERSREEVAERLQAAGIEAVPVMDFADLLDDPQLRAREHFQPMVHPLLGDAVYERNGFRLSHAPSGYEGPAPVLGQHTDAVLAELLHLPPDACQRLARDGGVET